jgi:hypothetical protein
MDNFYVTLPSDSSAEYFPNNTIANFNTKLAMPIQLEHDEWEVGLVEISYPTGYRKRTRHNTLSIGNETIEFPVKHYGSLLELSLLLSKHYPKGSVKRDEFDATFDDQLESYLMPEEVTTEIQSSAYGDNSIQLRDSIVSHFPVRTYKGLKDLFDTIMKPGNHSSSRVVIFTKDNIEFNQPEPVYVYTDIIKPSFVGDTFARLLTPLHFPSSTGYHRFDFPLYKPLERPLFETISIRIVTKNGSDVVFDDSVIPCLAVLHFKKRNSIK